MMRGIVFKIRDRGTGLFSKGGSTPRWSKNGKIWKTAAHLSSHLRGVEQFNEYCASPNPYGYTRPEPVDMASWEVVHLRTEEVAAQPAADYVRGRKILREKSMKIQDVDARQS